jgi:copper chaperone
MRTKWKVIHMKKIALNVKGMHCASCEMLIQEALVDIGARKVDASHKKGTVQVEFDDSKITLDKIKEAIKKEGYEVA